MVTGIGKWSALHTIIVVAILIIIASFVGGLFRKILWGLALAVVAIHFLAELSKGSKSS